MSCVLRIIGQDLDVDAFILKSKLKSSRKGYKGEVVSPPKRKIRKLKYSWVSITTSDASFNAFKKQIKDTWQYLKKNKEKLAVISETKGIQYAVLDFGIYLKMDKELVRYQTKYFPEEFVKLCGELGLGIELSIYPKYYRVKNA